MAEAARSCVDCPSFLNSWEAGQFFGKSIGLPMCAQFGHVLGWKEMKKKQERRLHRKFANDCKKYKVAKPEKGPERPEARMFAPDPDAMAEAFRVDDEDRVKVGTCLNCKHFIEPHLAEEKFGVTSGVCAVQGRVLLPHRLTHEASDCGYRTPKKSWESGNNGSNLDLLPIYIESKQVGLDPVAAFLASEGKNLIDPQDYETEAPVSDYDRSKGIRAWRKIPDPSGSERRTFLPIFDVEYFSDEEQAKIPRTGDDEHPEWYVDTEGLVYALAIEWMELDESPALWGQAGVGKTELARHMAWLMGLPFERLSITRSSEIDDLAGKYVFVDGETVFEEGRVVKAWQKPCVILIDEPNLGPDDVWQFFRPLTDNSRQLVLDMADARRYERHEYCFFTMAMNPPWDPKNIGTNEIGDADGNRLAHIWINLPDPRVEKIVLKRWCVSDGWEPSEALLDFVMAIAGEIRNMVESDTVPLTWNLRPNIQVIRHLRWFDPVTAYKRAVTDMHEPEVAKLILDLVTTRLEEDEEFEDLFDVEVE